MSTKEHPQDSPSFYWTQESYQDAQQSEEDIIGEIEGLLRYMKNKDQFKSHQEVARFLKWVSNQVRTIHTHLMIQTNWEDDEIPYFPSAAFLEIYLALRNRFEQFKREHSDFPWPGTEVYLSAGKGVVDWNEGSPELGMLKAMGYQVGKTAKLSGFQRRNVLTTIFKGHLSQVGSESYTDEWGDPATKKRLRKMAETIASMCRLFKRKDEQETADFSVAIDHYESDLQWLKETYYDGPFDFGWPDSGR